MRGCPPVRRLGVGLTTPHFKKAVYYEMLYRAEGLDGFFGAT
jgi:predicted kinase